MHFYIHTKTMRILVNPALADPKKPRKVQAKNYKQVYATYKIGSQDIGTVKPSLVCFFIDLFAIDRNFRLR